MFIFISVTVSLIECFSYETSVVEGNILSFNGQ